MTKGTTKGRKLATGFYRFGIIRDTSAVGGARTQYISPAASFLPFGIMENPSPPCYILVNDQ